MDEEVEGNGEGDGGVSSESDTTSTSTTKLACMKSSSAWGYKSVATFLTFMYGMTNLATSHDPAIDSEPSPSLTLLRLHESRMRRQNKHTN